MKAAFVVIVVPILVACGESSSSSNKTENKDEAKAPVAPFSIVAATSASFAACNAEREGALGYAKDDKKFYACTANAWTEIEVKGEKGADGLKIDKRFRYHTSTYVGQQDIGSQDTASYNSKIGTIQLVKFTDGSAFVSVNGRVADTSVTPVVYFDFGHTFLLPADTKEQEYIVKLDSFVSLSVRYKIDLSAAIPTFKAVVDTDGNYANNTDFSYTLTAL